MLNLDRMTKRPVFQSIDDERRYRKERLVGALRLFADFGYAEGGAGHISVRDPEYLDCFWTNPFGMHFGQIRVSDLVMVNHQGDVLIGNHKINVGAFVIHSQIHERHPEIEAIAHAHSIYGKIWSSLGRLLEPINQESCAFFESHLLFGDSAGLIETTQEAKELALALGGHKACILQNHGLLTVGRSVEECAYWYISMERSCQSQIIAESIGKPIIIEASRATYTRDQISQPEHAWFFFQPFWDYISRKCPDLFQ
ncbi:class II aldolase/adducin family protein [Brevibacillus invocatus]|uniref:class II aldolase/adducin family protein n=1 Tax=Brevibacillus invocatus TaxID=173959 RepID=UPI00203E71C1|nr:class II aldolase/adducin family protein [Brevibacillus invocatus]MCM3080636.1 class II aldolase/adducin family protein [Brevibacillus invocatus]MCM3432397.1 class II aldolase/adducin family protein [Brevibacillus invocatus]